MLIQEFKTLITDLFGRDRLELLSDESGFTYQNGKEIQRIGYATNLTPNTVKEAIQQEVDLIITHHDAWEFVYGMKEQCLKLLEEHQISHYFAHLPLDDAVFGTGASLLEKLGLTLLEQTHLYKGYYCGRIGEFQEGIEFAELVQQIESLLDEPVKAWKNHNRLIQRVCIVTGGGSMTADVKEAVDQQCDLYITGEKVLYTIQYASVAEINLLVGSHTFTEIFGVEALAWKIKEAFGAVEVVQLKEEHIE